MLPIRQSIPRKEIVVEIRSMLRRVIDTPGLSTQEVSKRALYAIVRVLAPGAEPTQPEPRRQRGVIRRHRWSTARKQALVEKYTAGKSEEIIVQEMEAAFGVRFTVQAIKAKLSKLRVANQID
jgi:hypothetical protein